MVSNNNKRPSWSAGLDSKPMYDELDNEEDAGIKLSTDDDNNNGDLDFSEGRSSISEDCQSSISEHQPENLISARKRPRVENQMDENEVHIQSLPRDGNDYVDDIDIRGVNKDTQSHRSVDKSCIELLNKRPKLGDELQHDNDNRISQLTIGKDPDCCSSPISKVTEGSSEGGGVEESPSNCCNLEREEHNESSSSPQIDDSTKGDDIPRKGSESPRLVSGKFEESIQSRTRMVSADSKHWKHMDNSGVLKDVPLSKDDSDTTKCNEDVNQTISHVSNEMGNNISANDEVVDGGNDQISNDAMQIDEHKETEKSKGSQKVNSSSNTASDASSKPNLKCPPAISNETVTAPVKEERLPPASMDVDMSSSSQIDDTASNEQISKSTLSMDIPKSSETNTTLKRQPSLGQLKMALSLEASKVHRDKGAEQMFVNYWENLEKYISLEPKNGMARSDSSMTADIEDILKGFLITRKMKRLHNKLVLAIMAEALMTDISTSCKAHIPQNWQIKDGRIDDSERLQLNKNFGLKSGTWSVCGDDLITNQAAPSNVIQPSLVATIRCGDTIDEEIIPSARLSGALEIEPMVRKLTAHSGIQATDNAIWMLVVAVREYSSSLIKKIIANDKDLDEGYSPQLPTHFQTSLACQHLLENPIRDEDDANKKKIHERRVINSTSLSHVLGENPASSSSRLTSMYTDMVSDDRGLSSRPPDQLEHVKCIINASIQRAAKRREKTMSKSKPKAATLPTTTAASTQMPTSAVIERQLAPLALPITASTTSAQNSIIGKSQVSEKSSMLPSQPFNQPQSSIPQQQQLIIERGNNFSSTQPQQQQLPPQAPSTQPSITFQNIQQQFHQAQQQQQNINISLLQAQQNQLKMMQLARLQMNQRAQTAYQPQNNVQPQQLQVNGVLIHQPIYQPTQVTMPLSKPGFPGTTINVQNTTLKASPPPSSVTTSKSRDSKSSASGSLPLKQPTPPLPPQDQTKKTDKSKSTRPKKRGSKDLGNMTKPVVQPSPPIDERSTASSVGTSDTNKKDGASPPLPSSSSTTTKRPIAIPGRGFGVKNLAAMRARVAASGSKDSEKKDPEKKESEEKDDK